jgi:putative spermidine/putrescine transport system ATP-binding protein
VTVVLASDPADPNPLIEFRNTTKMFDPHHCAVAGLNLAIQEGEFLTLLGPSGSGKTTTLMMLAGFQTPTAGDILHRNHSLLGIPPHRRNMGVVFQSYALFPHMTVAGNLAFPLSVRGVRGAAARSRVVAALNLVGLNGLGPRRPCELSGGQQQRVALARALIFEPDVVLMDEPLGALDKQLREYLQIEIKHIQRELGVTVIYVTHDQSEALALSDRIAVFNQGRLQQLGPPQQLYERPQNAFVAGFVGENNLIDGQVMSCDGARCTIRTAGGLVLQGRSAEPLRCGSAARATVRPDRVNLDPRAEAARNRFDSRVVETVYLGDHIRVRVVLSGDTQLRLQMCLRVRAATQRATPGTAVTVGWPPDQCLVFPLAA